MRKFITINTSKFPLVVARCKPFAPTLDELRDAQQDVEDLAHTYSDFVLIVDLTDLHFVPPEYRSAQAKWSEQTESLFAKQKMRLAFYTPSSIARIMLKGVFIIRKPAVPHVVLSSLEQAFAWAQNEMLQSESVSKRRKFIKLDVTKFPLVIAQSAPFEPTRDEFRDAMMAMEGFIQSHRNFVLVIDLTTTAAFQFQFKIATRIANNSQLLARQNFKVAFCTSSRLYFFIFKTLLRVGQRSPACMLTKKFSDGCAWALKQPELKN